MSRESIEFFSKLIEKETGIVYGDFNVYQLQTRLEEICKHEKIASLDELQKKFSGLIVDQTLKQKLLDISTNNETLFFRDPTFFAALESYLLREVLLDLPSEIKIWSAASSTGQEAVSVAIALQELSEKVSLPPFSIVATDICEKALLKARSGVYSDFEVMRGLSEDRKNKHLDRRTEGWQVKPSIHNKIRFGYNNLIKSTVTGPFHIILCRNVFIYHKVEVKKMIVESLLKQLGPTGAIMLGVGETLLGVKDEMQTTMVGNVIFYRKSA